MSINNQDKLDTLFKKLEEDIESGKFLEYLKLNNNYLKLV